MHNILCHYKSQWVPEDDAADWIADARFVRFEEASTPEPERRAYRRRPLRPVKRELREGTVRRPCWHVAKPNGAILKF